MKMGYFKDSVFTFYYPENLEALEANGAQLVPISSWRIGACPKWMLCTSAVVFRRRMPNSWRGTDR